MWTTRKRKRSQRPQRASGDSRAGWRAAPDPGCPFHVQGLPLSAPLDVHCTCPKEERRDVTADDMAA